MASAAQFGEERPAAEASPPEEPSELPAVSLLDRALAEPPRPSEILSSGRYADLARAGTVGAALRAWYGTAEVDSRPALARRINRDIAEIDAAVNRQLNAILHHPHLQRLEASWRGVERLVEGFKGAENCKIKLLNATWRELERDFERAVEFDQSQVFKKVYEDEFGTPGGEPFGILLGDYEMHPGPSEGHPTNDLSVLRSMAQVAAAAFCPFITAASPKLLGLESFADLELSRRNEKSRRLENHFQQIELLPWRNLRDLDDARFLGLVLPHTLARVPYAQTSSRTDGFCFREEVHHARDYLWGNAIYSLGHVVLRSFMQTAWLAEIRGVEQDIESGGLVTDLPIHSFGTDSPGVAQKISTEVAIGDQLERDLTHLGFIPLCSCRGTPYSAFYAANSLQKPKVFDRPVATENARLSAMLPHILCVSRFAHYLKVLVRDKVGSFAEATDVERFLHDWFHKYVTSDTDASPETRARYPLREAKVAVRERPGSPGHYQCTVHLRPHFQLEELKIGMRIVTEVVSKPSTGG